MISSKKCGRRSTKRSQRCGSWRREQSPIQAKGGWSVIIGSVIPRWRRARNFAQISNKRTNASKSLRRIFTPERSGPKMENASNTSFSSGSAARRSGHNSWQTRWDHGTIRWTLISSITPIRMASIASSTRSINTFRKRSSWSFPNLVGPRKHEMECWRRKQNSKQKGFNSTGTLSL